VVAEPSDGTQRFRLLEPIRQYAHARLAASGGLEAVRERHARFYLAFAERIVAAAWGPRLYAPFGNPSQVAAFARLGLDLDNLRAALRWAEEHADAEAGLRLGVALWSYWFLYGYPAEGRRWLESALAHGPDCAPVLRARAFAAAGLLAYAQADYPRAAALEARAVDLFRATGDAEE